MAIFLYDYISEYRRELNATGDMRLNIISYQEIISQYYAIGTSNIDYNFMVIYRI